MAEEEEQGTGPPRAFICYAREDRKLVYPEVDWLRGLGFDVHIDRHITPGVQWMEAVAEAISSSRVMLFYVSPNSVRSDYCAQEIRFALHRGVSILAVKLAQVELPPWMELAIGDSQVLERYDMSQRSYRTLLEQGLATHLDRPEQPRPSLVEAAPRYRRWSLTAVGAVLTLALAAGVVFWRSTIAPRIAVLPFDVGIELSPLARGIAGDVAEGLLKLDLIAVQSPDTASSNQGATTHTLSGAIEQREDGYAVRQTLTNARTGEQIWGQSWIYLDRDAAAVRRQHARNVLAALPDVLVGSIDALDRATAEQRQRAEGLEQAASALLEVSNSQADVRRARQLYEQALNQRPGFGPPLLGLCRVRLKEFQLAREVERLVQAETRCLQALAVGAEATDTHLALGDVFIARGNADLARTHYQRASALAPERPEVWIGLGTVSLLAKDDDLALEYYKKAVSLPEPGWEAYNELGRYYITHGNFAEAAEQYQRVAELTPNSSMGHNNLGAALFYLGEFEQASEAWRRTAEIEPDPMSWGNVGAALTYQKRLAEAADAFRTAAELAPADHRWWGHYGEVLAYDPGADKAEAQRVLTHARQLAEQELKFASETPELTARLSTYDALLGDETAARARLQTLGTAELGLRELYCQLQTLTLLGDETAATRARQQLLDAGHPSLLLEQDPWLE